MIVPVDRGALADLVARDLATVPLERAEREDIEISERVQEGLASRAYDCGRFSVTFESGVYHFQQLLKGAYRDWLDSAAR